MKKKLLSIASMILLTTILTTNVLAASYVPTTIYKDSTCPSSAIEVDQDGIEWKVVAKPSSTSTIGTYTGASADVILEKAWIATDNKSGSAAYVWLGSQGQIDAGLTWSDNPSQYDIPQTTGWRAVINIPYGVRTTWAASHKILPYGHNYNIVYSIYDSGFNYNGTSYPYVQLDVYDIGTKQNPTWSKVDTLQEPTTVRMSNNIVEMASIAYGGSAKPNGTYFGNFYFDNTYLYGKSGYYTWDNSKSYYVAKGTVSGHANQVSYSAQTTGNYASKVTLDMNYDR